MTRTRLGCLVWSWSICFVALAACGKDEGAAPMPGNEGPPEGYVRYEPPTMTVQPGETKMYLQWVAAPFDKDQNIIDLIGSQGDGGHHVILYTTKEIQPVGTTREFANADQADIQFVGGLGGEGGTPVKLPPGVVFRVPAGRGLLLQTHYFNPTDEVIEGHSVVDVKFGDPAPGDQVAHFFASALHNVSVAPHADTTSETVCELKKDLPMLMYSNHMHELGVTIKTTLTDAVGTVKVLKDDPTWNTEWIYNPDYVSTTAESPMILPAGSTLTTRCEWHNTTDKTWEQPDEMCVFFGFFLGDKDITCSAGHWIE
jgi:copper type II ascorbate-dependent monooxygenase-like protein